MKKITITCVECGTQYPFAKDILTCLNHDAKFSYLEIRYDYKKINQFPVGTNKAWSRYLPLLPVNKFQISLGEVSTIPCKLQNFGKKFQKSQVYLKDESKNPTGSFKDKESIISVNLAMEFGFRKVFSISSGNGALSACAYSTKAGLLCECFVPKKTSKAKLDMIQLLGGRIFKLPGSYEDVYSQVFNSGVRGWNITSGFNPYGNEGDKITAFEIWEAIGVPDYVLVPCGNGGNLYGIWKGFRELNLIGKTKKIPKMIGVQIENAAPLLEAINSGKSFVSLRNIPDSIAEGIVASESYTSPKAVKAIKMSKGEVITVTDLEIKQALGEIIKTESVVPEVTSASVFAALPKLKCSSSSKIVLIMTGAGMKYLNLLNSTIK